MQERTRLALLKQARWTVRLPLQPVIAGHGNNKPLCTHHFYAYTNA